MPADYLYRLDLTFNPDTDGEVVGERRLVFEGEIADGNPTDGGVSARGRLEGNFAVDAEESIDAFATVETFTRGGMLAFVSLEVRDDSGRSSFLANLRSIASGDEGDELEGVAFLGWPTIPARDEVS